MTFFRVNDRDRFKATQLVGWIAKLSLSLWQKRYRILTTAMCPLIASIFGLDVWAAQAEAAVPFAAPLYKGVVSGMDSCGPDLIVVASDDGVYQFKWLDGVWQQEMINALPSAGVVCSSDGRFLSVANEYERRILWRTANGWSVIDTRTETRLSSAVFAGPSFLVEIPDAMTRGQPITTGRSFSQVGDAVRIASYQFDASGIFELAASFDFDAKFIRIGDVLDASDRAISLVAVLFPDLDTPLPVFNLGDARRNFIAWFSRSLNSWQVGALPVRTDPFDIEYEPPLATTKATSRIKTVSLAGPHQEAWFLDCTLGIALICSSGSMASLAKGEETVSVTSGAALVKNSFKDCYRAAALSGSRTSPCFSASWQGKSLIPVVFESVAARGIVAFALADKAVEPDLSATVLFDLPMPH